jgi:hypothetical protein
MERQLEPKSEENEGHFSRARGSNESVFSGQNRVLLGLVAASLVQPHVALVV